MPTKIPPKRTNNRKGPAPLAKEINGNLDRGGAGLVPMQMRVPPALRKEIGLFARKHDTNATQLMLRGYQLIKAELGG